LSFVAGLGLGLLIAFVVYLEVVVPRMPGGGLAASAPSAGGSPGESRQGETPAAATKPRFDFYAILPEEEVKVPEWDLKAPPQTPQPQVPGRRPVASPYMIQVASFQRHEEADRAKARLALIGISANIQRVVINGTDVWFRVRVGPFNDANAMEGTRARLAEHNINFMLVRLRPGE
jgi:cell division protein FtsN